MKDSTLKVLMVLDGLDVGGTETYVLSIVEELKQRGVSFVIVSRGGVMLPRFQKLGFPIYEVNFPYTLHHKEAEQEPLIQQLKEIMTKEQVTLVHGHQTPSSVLAFRAAKHLKLPTVFTVHGTYYARGELLDVLPLATKLICVSPPIEKFIQELTDTPTAVIANGVDTNEYSPKEATDVRRELGIPDDALVLLYSSRIAWTKASICLTMLKAAKDIKLADFPHLHVVVVGGGPRMQELIQLTATIHQSTKAPFIHLVGEQYDMQRYFSVADCVVGTGRIALEAMACGKPLIASGSHGYFGIVEASQFDDAWHCYFGDHGSRQPCSRFAFVKDFRSFLSQQERLLQAGKDSRAWMMDRFNITHRAGNLFELYRSL
ncbi:glycosyltransferase [Fictibacillus macauensis ZFHKF-1]|uniref:Glycosyltransferase n=1 Tax=Fictibacillus macauensis ZFHKF-1 TaxID=1196324 RepID=I8ALZ4_9BACL|nr:glycosyltransferase [Fictibacillus macauensis]EIT86679.1 glycosyltransferase [Fictibacillus macauensis ZFHKF-1]